MNQRQASELFKKHKADGNYDAASIVMLDWAKETGKPHNIWHANAVLLLFAFNLGLYEEALRSAEELKQIDEDAPFLLDMLARIYEAQGRYCEAIASAERAVESAKAEGPLILVGYETTWHRSGRKPMVEYRGMILMHLPSPKHRQELEEENEAFCRWKYERFANHVHAQMNAIDREHTRQELEIAADFEADLRREYPEHSFVIVHAPCYAVSFYQLAEDAPTEDEVISVPAKEKVWCQNCELSQSYQLLPGTDAEFPQAE